MKRAEENNSQKIKELLQKIELCNMTLEFDEEDGNSYYVKADALAELWKIEDKGDYLKESLDCFNNAIKYAPQNRLPLIGRIKLNAKRGEIEQVLEDIRKVNSLPKNKDILDIYVKNTLEEIANLDNISIAVKDLYNKGKLSQELQNIFSELTSVTSELSVEINISKETLSNRNVSSADSRLAALEGEHKKTIEIMCGVVKLFQENKEITEKQQRQLQNQMNEQKSKLFELENKMKGLEFVTKDKFQQIEAQLEKVNIQHKAFGGKLNILAGKQNEQEVKIAAIDEALFSANIYKEVEVRQKFDELKKSNPKLYDYANKFYWTLSNYFLAYRSISTGMIEGKEPSKEWADKLFDTVLGVFTNALSNLPVVGGLVDFIENAVSTLYSEYQSQKFSRKIEKMNDIISKYMLEQDLNLAIAKAAINIAMNKEKIILNSSAANENLLEKATSWFEDRIDKLLAKATKIKLIYNSEEAKMALKDVALFLGHLAVSNEVLAATENSPLDNAVVKIFETGVLSKELVKSYELQGNQKGNCEIFYVLDMKYDNELLNHPELFKYLVQKIGLSEAFNLNSKFSQLDSNLAAEAIQEQNGNLLLAGLKSLCEATDNSSE